MIKAILIVNNHGKTRLCHFYGAINQKIQQKLIRDIFCIISKRHETACNFVELPKSWKDKYTQTSTDESKLELIELLDCKLIYRCYATLYFVFMVDPSESELGILDIIQLFVEALNERFANVCELDIVYNYLEVNKILDEIVMGGMVMETDMNKILKILKKY